MVQPAEDMPTGAKPLKREKIVNPVSTRGNNIFFTVKALGHGAKNKFIDFGMKMRPLVLCTQCIMKQSH